MRRAMIGLGLIVGLVASGLLRTHAGEPQAPAREAAWPVYAVVVAEPTRADADWGKVVEALVARHRARVITFRTSVTEAREPLQGLRPRYVCFVARPSEATRAFVVQVHRLTRTLDSDPFTDCLWGILTGYDAANALRIARCEEPLTVRRVAAGTEVALEMCEEGVWYCELKAGRMVKKEPGGEARELPGPPDTTEALVRTLTDYGADLFVTSGHATERDWQIGYTYRNGSFRCADGLLYGLDTQGRKLPIRSAEPKVYLPVGNCLMGHIDGPEAMALAWMNSAGVHQMIGYVVSTWYGYGGWGCLDYFVEQPGRFTFTEAFFANHHALIHRLQTLFPELLEAEVSAEGRMKQPSTASRSRSLPAGLRPQDGIGLAFDRDFVAFYGDPAWPARMAEGPTAWDQTLTVDAGRYIFEVRPRRGAKTFAPINENGSQRGGRPIIQFLPQRVRDVRILEGADLQPVVTDDFLLVPLPAATDLRESYRVVFQAQPAG